jgi:hypothetical protein
MFNIKSDDQKSAIFSSSTYKEFGFGYDIVIGEKKDVNRDNYSSFSNFGNCYTLPTGMIYDSPEAKSFLAGSEEFGVKEFEVFQVI